MNDKKVVQDIIFPENIDVKAERFLRKNECLTIKDDFQIGMPNLLNRSSVFSGEKRKENDYINNQEIQSYHKNVKIKYTGLKLDKRDQQVLYMCLIAMKNNKFNFGELFRIFPANWLSNLGRTDNSKSREELSNSLKRLSSSSITLLKKKNVQGSEVLEETTGSFLSGFNRQSLVVSDDEAIVTNRKIDIKWLVMINPFLKDFYTNDLTVLDLKMSAKIKSMLGLWLFDFYSSHNDPIPLSTRRIQELSGLNSNISHFHQSLKKSLNELVNIGFLVNFSIENKSKDNKVLSVVKNYRSPIINVKNRASKVNNVNKYTYHNIIL